MNNNVVSKIGEGRVSLQNRLISLEELASKTEFSSAMINTLASRGLLEFKKQKGRRLFPDDTLSRLAEISDLLFSGLSLDEISRFYGRGAAGRVGGHNNGEFGSE